MTSSQAATMPLPTHYREWVFLAAGLDMTYTTPAASTAKAATGAPVHQVFDNVFVNPEAYRTFVDAGIWPDGTTFVLENRAAEGAVSINKAGRTQGANIKGIEIHTKQHGTWAFYTRAAASDTQAKLIARPASCYTCHEQYAAVDTTFVQFYPTLLPLAQQKKLLSPAYLHDEADHATVPPAGHRE